MESSSLTSLRKSKPPMRGILRSNKITTESLKKNTTKASLEKVTSLRIGNWSSQIKTVCRMEAAQATLSCFAIHLAAVERPWMASFASLSLATPISKPGC